MATSARVLVTRPAAQAGPLMALLRDAGYQPSHQPLLELEALPQLPPAQRRHVLDLDRYQHVIFISANAVRMGLSLRCARIGPSCWRDEKMHPLRRPNI